MAAIRELGATDPLKKLYEITLEVTGEQLLVLEALVCCLGNAHASTLAALDLYGMCVDVGLGDEALQSYVTDDEMNEVSNLEVSYCD